MGEKKQVTPSVFNMQRWSQYAEIRRTSVLCHKSGIPGETGRKETSKVRSSCPVYLAKSINSPILGGAKGRLIESRGGGVRLGVVGWFL